MGRKVPTRSLTTEARLFAASPSDTFGEMPLCDYFIASAAELETVGSEGVPKKLLRVDAKGFDMVPIEALAKRLKVKAAVDPGEPIVHGDDFEWFAQRLTAPMLDALSGLDEASTSKHGKAIAGIPELGWSPEQAQKLLRELVVLAKAAKTKKKAMYMWVST